MENMKISHCLAFANLVEKHLLRKEAKIRKKAEYSSGLTVYLVVDETIVCVNKNLGFYRPRMNSASIVVINGDGRIYSFQSPYDELSFDLYYAFCHLEGVKCDDGRAEIVISRGSHKDNNLLFNQSGKLFRFAFGIPDAGDKYGRIICERVL